MKAGYTFTLNNQTIDPHLWIIISDPEVDSENVLIVSVTTDRAGKDRACCLLPSDHPWIRHSSLIAFQHAKVTTLAKLFAAMDAGQLTMHDPASTSLLKKIRDSVADSTTIKMDYYELLVSQGLIEDL